MDPNSQIENKKKTEDFRKFIEVEVLQIIKALAEKGDTPQEKMQQIAQTTLELITPQMNLEQLYQNAVKLDDNFSELAPVVFKVMDEYEKTYEKSAIDQVSQLVNSGKYDEAQDMVKKVLQFKVSN